MSKRTKVKANELCPCGSLLKYKKCCRGQVDWPSLLSGPFHKAVPHLSIRGRNMQFLNIIADALQLDSFDHGFEVGDWKRAFTPAAIRKIYEGVDALWPNKEDLGRALAKEQQGTSGLYVGVYDPELLLRGITRHSLYADRILLVDPLMSPASVRPKYNPILHPEMHRTTTMRWVSLWLGLTPWILNGIVQFIKTPGDLDPAVFFEAMQITEQRYKKHPELEPKPDEMKELYAIYEQRLKQELLLGLPDDHIRQTYLEMKPDATYDEIENLIEYIQQQREKDPFFTGTLDKKPDGELTHYSSGAS